MLRTTAVIVVAETITDHHDHQEETIETEADTDPETADHDTRNVQDTATGKNSLKFVFKLNRTKKCTCRFSIY